MRMGVSSSVIMSTLVLSRDDMSHPSVEIYLLVGGVVFPRCIVEYI